MIAVIGGGQVGTYHARQLLKAIRSGRLPGEELLVVDRDPGCQAFRELEGAGEVSAVRADWEEFLRRWLTEASDRDSMIPPPWAPHLLGDWVRRQTGAVEEPPPRGWRLPYEVVSGATLYLSAAAWLCPATCVEPAHCPALHAPRDWDLGDLIEAGARERGYLPLVFRLAHLGGGVAAVPAREIRDAALALREGAPGPALVATSSRCHAAVAGIRTSTSGPRGLKS